MNNILHWMWVIYLLILRWGNDSKRITGHQQTPKLRYLRCFSAMKEHVWKISWMAPENWHKRINFEGSWVVWEVFLYTCWFYWLMNKASFGQWLKIIKLHGKSKNRYRERIGKVGEKSCSHHRNQMPPP